MLEEEFHVEFSEDFIIGQVKVSQLAILILDSGNTAQSVATEVQHLHVIVSFCTIECLQAIVRKIHMLSTASMVLLLTSSDGRWFTKADIVRPLCERSSI